MSSASSFPTFASSTPSVTNVPPPTSSSNGTTLRVVATIIPIVVIVAIVIWGLLIAAGVMHHRRGLVPPATARAPLHSYYEKWPEHLEEPKLWDVHTETVEVKPYLENLHPLSVELFSDTDSLHKHKHSLSWRRKDHGTDAQRQRRRWRTFTETSLPRPGPHSQEAQVSVFVAMPSPERRPGQPMRDFAIGTRPVLYTSGEKKAHVQVEESVSSVEVPVLMDMCSYGYVG